MKFLIIFISLVFAFNSAKSEVIYKDNKIFVKNLIVNEFKIFKEIVFNNSVEEVVFENCYGGTILDGLVFNKIISDKKLTTRVDGETHSACSIAFMGGHKRSLTKKWFGKNLIAFHLGEKKERDGLTITDAQLKAFNDYVVQKLISQTDSAISQKTINLIKESTGLQGVFFETNYFFGKASTITKHCASRERSTNDYSDCDVLQDTTLENQKIITQ